MFNIIMLGPQGAGKGTQAETLAEKLSIPIVSVGKLFRLEIERATGLGAVIAKYVNAGDLVPNDLVDQVMAERLSEEDTENGIILDGYPRIEEQIGNLDRVLIKLGRQVTHVIYLNVADEVSLRRLAGRRVCSNGRCGASYHLEFNPPTKSPDKCDVCGSPLIQRVDDNPEAIKHRLDLYHRDTEPIVDHYRRQGILHEIDGSRSIAAVKASIDEIFGA